MAVATLRRFKSRTAEQFPLGMAREVGLERVCSAPVLRAADLQDKLGRLENTAYVVRKL